MIFKNYEDAYVSATKDARINVEENRFSSSLKWIIFNFLLVLLLGIILFFYLKNETTFFSEFITEKRAVLGVTKTVDESLSDEELIKILRVTDMEVASKNTNESELRDSMMVLVNESSIKSQSSYTEAISRELDDKNGFKGRTVVVKSGDTLSSLATKYYGDASAYSKIIEHNDNLDEGSYLLKIGQRIIIP
ncbi:MAG: Unknown protein [uncultured Sulfurovum sp.]|uniref:LysM domain-containing protein n=1 Tax=uncultured Sulfurovum sp. TaxID=269237 RepID=A0A6S6SNC8_9BACT|nr:MAG: Unknown protein [uncultured Sulfurovum sp.]